MGGRVRVNPVKLALPPMASRRPSEIWSSPAGMPALPVNLRRRLGCGRRRTPEGGWRCLSRGSLQVRT